MQNLLSKIKDFFQNLISDDNKKKLGENFKKYWKYAAAVILFILFVLVLVKCTGPKDSGLESEDTESAASEVFELDDSFEKNANEEINTLVKNYYTAYAAMDTDTLSKIAIPFSDNEKSYVGVFGQYIESYQNISCYTKHGPTEGSYLVSAYYEMKFYEVETTAPGLDFFYIEPDAEGKLYINNLYGSYNLNRVENELDANIYSVILQYIQQEDVIALQQEVDTKFNEAIASDANLATMITKTIPLEMKEWLASISVNGGEPSTEGSETTQEPGDSGNSETESESETGSEPESETGSEPESESETESESESESESETESESDSEPKVVKVRVNLNDVNIRSAASKSSDSLGKAAQGDTFTKTGQEGDWIQIEYNGGVGYIRSDLLTEVTE